MLTEDLKIQCTELLPAISFEEGGEWLNAYVAPEALKSFLGKLRSLPGLEFDYLFCLTCVDWKTHLTLVYHFTSTIHRHIIVIKAKLDNSNPEIETVSDIWRTAEMLEREVYDLFGVKFLHHPDLRRLIMPDDWKGWPLRKDYEDPVNMIKL
ncbi:MAG TPA: NADH-quinone oxidoreductase subunit C [Puia sp.]